MTDDTGAWLYCVSEHLDTTTFRDVRGVAQAPVRLINAAGLSAAVSDVSLAVFGEAPLRRNLEDLDWVMDTANAHHRVIDVAATHAPVVPMRLATLYKGDAGIALLCQEREDAFRNLLALLDRHREWGVKVYAAPAQSDGTVPAEPMSGAAYLQRRREQLTAARVCGREAAAHAETIHRELSRCAAQARTYPPQARELSGEKAAMLLNAAYLVDDARSSQFAAAVSSATDRYTGVRLVLTGPWPAYSFTGIEQFRGSHLGH